MYALSRDSFVGVATTVRRALVGADRTGPSQPTGVVVANTEQNDVDDAAAAVETCGT